MYGRPQPALEGKRIWEVQVNRGGVKPRPVPATRYGLNHMEVAAAGGAAGMPFCPEQIRGNPEDMGYGDGGSNGLRAGPRLCLALGGLKESGWALPSSFSHLRFLLPRKLTSGLQLSQKQCKARRRETWVSASHTHAHCCRTGPVTELL